MLVKIDVEVWLVCVGSHADEIPRERVTQVWNSRELAYAEALLLQKEETDEDLYYTVVGPFPVKS